MSYDIDVYTITNHHSSNYTSNISKMYYLAFKFKKSEVKGC